MTTVALMPIAEEADAAVAYAEGTVSWNIKMMLMTQGKSQTALAMRWACNVLQYQRRFEVPYLGLWPTSCVQQTS